MADEIGSENVERARRQGRHRRGGCDLHVCHLGVGKGSFDDRAVAGTAIGLVGINEDPRFVLSGELKKKSNGGPGGPA